LKTRLGSVFEQFQKQHPSTPLMLMSALAEGADRLAAEVALDAGIGLIVPLPMQQELYEQDFDEESRRQFRQVLERAEFSYELPLEPGNTVESVQAGRGCT